MNTQRAIVVNRRLIGILTGDDNKTRVVPIVSPGDDQALVLWWKSSLGE